MARKLTPEQAVEIRELYARGGITQQELANKYGVCRSCIIRLITYRTYTR